MSEEVRNGLMKQRRKAREKNKELQQENQQLKLDLELYKDNHSYANYEVEKLEGSLKTYEILLKANDIGKLTQELDLYKSVLNEVREFIKEKYKEDYSENYNYIPIENLNLKNCSYERSLQALAILDKVGDK